MQQRERPVVVVGVDGSAASLEALAWALDYARRAEAAVRVVTVWHHPSRRPATAEWDPALAAREIQQRSLECMDGLLNDVQVELVVEPGWPADILTEESDGAALLVLGATGHSPSDGGWVGSTTLHCVSHSHCSVTVVRHAGPT